MKKKSKKLIATSLLAIGLVGITGCSFNIGSNTTGSNNMSETSSSRPESSITVKPSTPSQAPTAPGTTAPTTSSPAPSVSSPSTPEKIYYRISFVNNGHGESIGVIDNTKALPSSLPELTENGYVFDGWYLDEALTVKAVAGMTILADTTLYAKWNKIEVREECSVFFNTNGGSQVPSVSLKKGELVTRPANPSKEHAIFKGWYLDNEYTTEFDFNSPVESNLVLYARFEDMLKVTFILNNEEYKTTYIEANTAVAKPADPDIPGYSFEGWYESLDDGSPFDFNNRLISNLTLYAKLSKKAELNVSYEAYEEGINLEFSSSSLDDTKIYYKELNASSYNELDKNLIRFKDDIITADILGLKAGSYEVLVDASGIQKRINVAVSAYDRSGYAHFNQSGIGAYNDDGTLKAGTNVVYVTEETKNTVSCTIANKKYTGLVAILNAQAKSKAPLDIRIIGQVSADSWKAISYKKGAENLKASEILDQNGNSLPLKSLTEDEIIKGGYNTLEGKYKQIKGITNSIKYSKDEFDSYYNMIDVSAAQNVTIEGVGSDALLYQFGFTWKKCSSIEVRNLTFDDYTEDACSFEGGDDSTTLEGFTTGHIWIHNNTFNEGNNKWDVCPEQDKHEGDGATDFKKNAYITVSYNHYYKNHKTGLVGGSDSHHTACLTFHHNFYDNCTSRLPLGRQANMHMYNNYYYKSTGTNMSIRANGYAFVENCYVEGCNNPFETKGTGVIKLYGTIVVSSKGVNNAYTANTRDELVKNSNLYSSNFDTDSDVFYYDATNKKSKVSYLTKAEQAKEDCISKAGAHKFNH